MVRKQRKAKFVHISNILADVLNKYRREGDIGLVQVWRIWDNIVGDVIAQNAKPAPARCRPHADTYSGHQLRCC